MENLKNKRKCYTYTRVSTEAQTEGYSLEAQQERLYEYAEYKGLDIAGEYCDAGKSGSSIKGRPQFRQMMEDIICRKDDVSYVLVFKLSRFGRNAADVLRSIQLLMDYGVDLVCVNDAIDSSTQGGRLTLAILSAAAEIERENITAQFRAGRLQKIRDGKWQGSPVPYGYRSVNKELEAEPEEAGIVRLIFDLYLHDGMSATGAASYLNDNGYLRKKDEGKNQKPFTYHFIAAILDNPIYCGRLVFGRRTNKKGPDGKTLKPDQDKIITARGVHQPIITEEEWEKVQEKRKRLSAWSRKTDDPDRTSLLSGLIKCPGCGAGMIAAKSKHVNKNRGGHYKTIHYYACPNSRKGNGKVCPFRHIYNQDKIDSSVFEIVQKLGQTPEFKKAVSSAFEEQASITPLEEALKQKRKELRNEEMRKRKLGRQLDSLDVFEESYEASYEELQGEIDRSYDRIEETERNIRSIMKKIESANKGVRALDGIGVMLENFRKLYDKMTCHEKRQMYRLFIDRIEVLPKTREDGKILKSISFRFAAALREVELTPEGDPDDGIRFTLDCTKLELTAAEAKATYAQIRKYILDTYGVKVSTLNIAQTKRKYGIDMGINYNRAADPEKKQPGCTMKKELLIMDALKHFKMLDPSVEYAEESGSTDEKQKR